MADDCTVKWTVYLLIDFAEIGLIAFAIGIVAGMSLQRWRNKKKRPNESTEPHPEASNG